MSRIGHPLAPLIQALLEPACYPHAVHKVALVQTHISWVLLAGDFAYKLKKPVKLPFLDFSTLAQRHRCCLEELRLNQRLAPDIYLEVWGIFETPQGPQVGAQSGLCQPIEYAVRMRRFDETGRLDHVCARGELIPAQVSDLADSLVAFHATAAVAAPESRFGSPTAIIAPALDNFTDLLRRLPDAGVQLRLAALRDWTRAQFERLTPLLEMRRQTGRVRECHGDLHLANMVLVQGRVRLFDCLEFNEGLRWIDVASEVAFPYVDLLAHGQTGLANWFVDQVIGGSGDFEMVCLLQFYAVYRALVRAKVAAIGQTQRGQEPDQALAYLGLAEQLAAPQPVRLIITHGLSGCGKTVATDQLLQNDPRARTLRLRSDEERKRLFGLTRTERSGSAVAAGIYTTDASERTYAHLRELAEMLLRAGWSVIVDASFLKQAERASFHALAKACHAAFAIVAPQATPDVLGQRILARTAQGRDASEATLEVLARQMRILQALDDEERQHVLALCSTLDGPE